MKKALKTYRTTFIAIIGLFVVSFLVGGFILSQQRLKLPHWVPGLGSDYVEYKAELSTAQAITPGQGQTVNIAGVPVGEIKKVMLKDGKAQVTMSIKRNDTPIYRDASLLVRPKTGLDDIVFELDPGTARAGKLSDDGDGDIPVSQTMPTVNLDEILSSLDGDTRSYLQLLLGGAGEGLKGQGRQLSADIKRFDPTARDLERVSGALKDRHTMIARTVHNFRLLSQALAGKDKQLSEVVGSSNAVFRTFASQDRSLRASLRGLPTALSATRTGLGKADTLARQLKPTLTDLLPSARALGPALRATRPFFKTTTPVIRDQLRPFARDARPTVRQLRPAAANLAKITPDLTRSFKVVNYLLNELAYDNPKDNNQSYLFWNSWVSHLGATLFGTGDAHGPIRRGAVIVSCSGLTTLDQLKAVNPQLGLLTGLLDPARASDVCPATSQAGASPTASARSVGGLSPLSPDAITPVKNDAKAGATK